MNETNVPAVFATLFTRNYDIGVSYARRVALRQPFFVYTERNPAGCTGCKAGKCRSGSGEILPECTWLGVAVDFVPGTPGAEVIFYDPKLEVAVDFVPGTPGRIAKWPVCGPRGISK